jgi:hypothetical protein
MGIAGTSSTLGLKRTRWKSSTVSLRSYPATVDGGNSHSHTTVVTSALAGSNRCDDVIGQQRQEAVGPHHHAVVLAVVVVLQARQPGQHGAAADRERVLVLREQVAAGVVGDGRAPGQVAELGQRVHQLGVDGAAVVALLEVLRVQAEVGLRPRVEPRCRQTLRKARSSPSRPRTTMTFSFPTVTRTKRPGDGTSSARHTYCHCRSKMFRFSRSKISGS